MNNLFIITIDYIENKIDLIFLLYILVIAMTFATEQEKQNFAPLMMFFG